MAALSPTERADIAKALVADQGLRPSSRSVGIALVGFLNGSSGEAFPSYRTLGEAACLKRRATIYAVQELEARGWLTIHRVSGGDPSKPKGWVTNRFVVHPPVHVDAPRPPDPPVHLDAPGPGAPACTTPVHGHALPPVHVDAPPPVHRRAPKLSDIELSDRNSVESISPASPRSPRRGALTSNGDLASDFAAWWRLYPRKVGKEAAEKAYRRVLTSGKANAVELLAGVQRFAAERSGKDPQYTKHAATWLNAGCWADEPEPQPAPRSLNGQEAARDWSNLDFGSADRMAGKGPIIEAEYHRVD